jgi:hypothetical protein
MTTPAWAAPVNGLPGNLNAADTAGGINQLLGAHAQTEVYKGNQILTPSGAQNFLWTNYGNATDLSQPFTLSGTAIGRVEVPLQPNGNGADVLVSLYADNGSGSPNITAGAICSTLLPAQYLNQVCATTGLANAGPLATAANYTRYYTGAVTTTTYQPPLSGPGGIGGGNSATVSGSYLTLCGGNVGSSNTNVVYSIQYLGGGVIGRGVSQPSMPDLNYGAAIASTQSSIYILGGLVGSSATTSTAVWQAAWNSSTGLVSSWSSQTSLPTAVSSATAQIWNGTYIYAIGGLNSSNAAVSMVNYAAISNGQIGAWVATTALPVALTNAYSLIIGNWLIVAGGSTTSLSTGAVNTVYYAPINPTTGALGAWQVAPAMTTALMNLSPGWGVIGVDDALIVFSGENTAGSFVTPTQILAWDSHGPASEWRQLPWPVTGTAFHPLYVANGDGSWDVATTNFGAGVYYFTKLLPVPIVSVPLPATGLTNGATYHVVLRQFSSTSSSDYVAFGTLDGTPLPSAAVTHGRYASGAWTSVGTGRSIPMSVFDQTAGGQVLHTWEDASSIDMASTAARWSALQYNWLGLLIGACEMTLQPNQPLNSNPTFTSGVSPWTASNGTITQSSAQTHGGYAFSGLLTPTGGFASAAALSELFPITQTPWGSAQWLMAMGWFYSSTGWSSFSLSVNWYDSSKTLISTSSNTVSFPAATWTQVNNWFQPPATAAYGQLAPTESGTPGATNLLYMSYVYGLLTPETVGALTSAATVNYASGSYWPPIGVTQLN